MKLFVIALFMLIVCLRVNSTCKEVERNALLKFKHSFYVDRLNVLGSWVGDDCCSWKGVGCDNVTNTVIKLDLSSKKMKLDHSSIYWIGYSYDDMYDFEWDLEAGEVSPALLELKYLTYLDLSGVSFNGSSIPEFFGAMKQLQHLNLSHTHFYGKFPQNLGNLTKLVAFNLHSSPFWSSIEMTNSMDWAFKLENLQYLDLSGVDLSQTLDSLEILHKLPSLSVLNMGRCGLKNSHLAIKNSSVFPSTLQRLDLSYNFLIDPFPHFIQKLSSLRFLDLSTNGFSSSLPLWLKNHVNLTHVDLGWNYFKGSFPSFIQNLSSILCLSLSGNQFTSSIPHWLVNKTNLEQLSLGSNYFHRMDGGFMNTISHLCSLKYLDLSSNQLQEEVSNSHVNFSRCITYDLEFLYLGDNNFNGYLPNFETFSSLRDLDLSSNSFEIIPSSLGGLSSLINLDLSYNPLKAGLPLIGNLSSLIYLDLSNIILKNIPSTLWGLSSLTSLDLSYNQLKVVSPLTGNLSSLEGLDLSHNNFKILPSSFGKGLSSLTFLSLSYNHLKFMSSSLGGLSSLTRLDVSYNRLKVVFPLTGNLSSLKDLDLSHNNLVNIPSSLGRLSSLISLGLQHNSVSVVNQASLANLSSLRHLDLSLNSLILNFSSDWLPPFQLETLNLLPCKMNGLFPKWILSQENIAELDLSNTGIFGPLPSNIGNVMPYLLSLRLANNHINGSIPRSLCELTSLNFLNLKNNTLSGTIPDCWMNSSILEMELSSNKLIGHIPNSLTTAGELQLLSLNSNSLQGKIPLSLSNCVRLTVLDVGRNNLHGKISIWSGAIFPYLQVLILRGNRFEGIIPSQICSIQTLQVVDLANNKLGGTIPKCFGSFKGMGSEDHSSHFIASPPSPMFSNAENASFAEAPTNEWSAMEVIKGEEMEYTTILHLLVNMDLSCNNLVGVIPAEIITSTRLISLNFSHNHLNGTIPKEIGRMKSLESFDISCNNISGSIPESISSLTFLSTMNLSFNNLQGKIPTSTQLGSFNDSSYMGNPCLCGDPLPKKCFGDDIAPPPTSKILEDEDNKHEKMWFYLIIISGFATGFWAVIGSLVVLKRWRHVYFQFAENLADCIYVRVTVKIARAKGRN